MERGHPDEASLCRAAEVLRAGSHIPSCTVEQRTRARRLFLRQLCAIDVAQVSRRADRGPTDIGPLILLASLDHDRRSRHSSEPTRECPYPIPPGAVAGALDAGIRRLECRVNPEGGLSPQTSVSSHGI